MDRGWNIYYQESSIKFWDTGFKFPIRLIQAASGHGTGCRMFAKNNNWDFNHIFCSVFFVWSGLMKGPRWPRCVEGSETVMVFPAGIHQVNKNYHDEAIFQTLSKSMTLWKPFLFNNCSTIFVQQLNNNWTNSENSTENWDYRVPHQQSTQDSARAE